MAQLELNVPITFDAAAALTINEGIEQKVQNINGEVSRIEQKADNIAIGVQNAGINIDAHTITLNAETTQIKNGNTTTAMFTSDGKIDADFIDADNIEVGRFETTGTGQYSGNLQKAHIVIEDGLLKVFGNAGVANIVMGYDSNNGQAILKYYNNSEQLLYDLGPDGITKTISQNEERKLENWYVLKTWDGENWTFYNNDYFSYGYIEDLINNTNSNGDTYLKCLLNNINLASYNIYKYEAKITAGIYSAGNYAESAGAAELYNNVYLCKAPTTSNKLPYNNGELDNAWALGCIRISLIETWRTYTGEITYINNKAYCIPSDINDGMTNHCSSTSIFECDTSTGEYITPIIVVYYSCYYNGDFQVEYNNYIEKDLKWYFSQNEVDGN